MYVETVEKVKNPKKTKAFPVRRTICWLTTTPPGVQADMSSEGTGIGYGRCLCPVIAQPKSRTYMEDVIVEHVEVKGFRQRRVRLAEQLHLVECL